MTSAGSDSVSVINAYSHRVVAAMPVGVNLDGIACDSRDGEVYVSNFGDNTVSVINASNHNVTNTLAV